MSWIDYTRHMAEGQRALDLIDVQTAARDPQTVLFYAVAHFLAALAAMDDPGGELAEFCGEGAATTDS